jgi:hypothetical protein
MFAEVKGDMVVTWPYNYDTLCQANPSTAFPSNKTLLEMYSGTESNLDGNVLVKVVEQPQPSYDAKTQTVAQAAQPVLSNGEWQLGWVVSTLTAEQQAAAQDRKAASVRVERNQKLKDCDFTQLVDAPVDRQAWVIYRQNLRDITSQSGFPWNVTWPEEP